MRSKADARQFSAQHISAAHVMFLLIPMQMGERSGQWLPSALAWLHLSWTTPNPSSSDPATYAFELPVTDFIPPNADRQDGLGHTRRDIFP